MKAEKDDAGKRCNEMRSAYTLTGSAYAPNLLKKR
jgi:hypothetical protein